MIERNHFNKSLTIRHARRQPRRPLSCHSGSFFKSRRLLSSELTESQGLEAKACWVIQRQDSKKGSGIYVQTANLISGSFFAPDRGHV